MKKLILTITGVLILLPLSIVAAEAFKAGSTAFSKVNQGTIHKSKAFSTGSGLKKLPDLGKTNKNIKRLIINKDTAYKGNKFASCAQIKAGGTPFTLAKTDNGEEYGILYRGRAGAAYKTRSACGGDLKSDQCKKSFKKLEKKYAEMRVKVAFKKLQKDNKGERIGVIAADGKAVSRRICYKRSNVCTVVIVNDEVANTRPEIRCISPDGVGVLSRSAKDKNIAHQERLKDLRCQAKGDWCIATDKKTGKKITIKKKELKVFGGKDGTKLKPVIRRPQPKPRLPIHKPQRGQQSKQGSSGGAMSGIMKSLQGLFNNKQKEDSRKKREAAMKKAKEDREYQMRMRLPVCHSAHPYYEKNKARCTGNVKNKNIQIESYDKVGRNTSGVKSTGVLNTTTTSARHNSGTTAEIASQKCKDKKPKAIIVARPLVVESGKEASIKWASVCTASCKVTAKEVGVESTEPILTELGRKGEVKGRLYNDTRFDLECKDFNDQLGATSTITVRLKK